MFLNRKIFIWRLDRPAFCRKDQLCSIVVPCSEVKLDMSVAFVREPYEVPVISRLRRIYSRLSRINSQLDQITAAAAEAKHVTGEWILAEHTLDLRRQAVEPLAHVGGTGRQPHPGPRRQAVHRSRSMTCRSVSEQTSPRRRTRAPQPNTISITPSRSLRGRSPSGAISTGTMVPLSTTAFGNSCRRHLNRWLLFTSWRRATTDTDAPGASVSATIWRFNASEYCRRFGCSVSTKPLMDTCSA